MGKAQVPGMPKMRASVFYPYPHVLPLKKNNSLPSFILVAPKVMLCLLPSLMPTSASHLVLTVGDLAHREDQSLLG